MLLSVLTACLLLLHPFWSHLTLGMKGPASKDGLCPKGWWRSYIKCYILLPKTIYPEAFDHCNSKEGTMAVLQTEELNDFARQILVYSNTQDSFIGLTNPVKATEFRWETGEKLRYSNWNPDAKFSDDTILYCVLLKADGWWYKANCVTEHPVLCEKPIRSGTICNMTEMFEL